MLLQRGCRHMLLKGRHGPEQHEVLNRWISTNRQRNCSWPRLPGEFHGSGCTQEPALAALLARAFNLGQAIDAAQTYYPSRIKKYPVTTAPDIVTRAKAEIALPNVVIGGMTQQNALPRISAGADMVVAISGVYLVDDPTAAVREFTALFEPR